MADIDIDDLIRQFGNNYPKWVNDAIGSRLETTNKLLKELQKQKTASNPEFKKEVDNRKQINKELVAEKKLVEAQNKSLKETNDLYKNLKQNLGGLVKNIDKFKKDLDTMSAQSNSKELVKQSKELSKETAARKELTKTVDRQTINQVTYILTQKELNKTTRILDKQFGGLSKTIDVLVKKISNSDISNQKPVDVDFTAFNKSMMSFQTQMDGVIKKQDEFAKKIKKITDSINEPTNQNNGASEITENHKKLQNAIDKSKDKLDSFSDRVDKSARAIGESIQSFSDVKNLGSAVSGVMVTLLGNIPKIGLAVAGVSLGAKLYIDEMMIARTAFSQLSTSGFGLGTDLQGLSQIARDGRMSIEDLQNAMAMNKTAFMALGQDAASIFSKLSGTANETSSLFKKFGMSVEETNEFLSNNLEYQRTTGRLRNMSDQQRSALAEQELMRLAKTQSVFGKSIKEITSSTSDYMQRSSTLANVIQITRGMSADDKQRVMGNFANFRQQVAGSAMTPEMQDITMKMIAVQIAKQEGRPLLDREQQEMAQLMKQMPELSRYIEQSVAQGNATEDFTKDLNTILKDQFLNDSEALTRLSLVVNNSPDQKLRPMADAIIASVGQTFGYDEDEAQKRIDATANIANSTDATMKAINEVEFTIANVESAFKSALVNIFGQNFGTDLVGTITANLNQFVDVFKAYTDKVTDPNYTGSIVQDEVKAVATAAGLGYAGYKASRFGNSLGERLANRPPPNRLPPVTPPDSPDSPDSAKSKSKFGKAFKAIPYLAPLLAIADGVSGINDEEFKEAGMGGSQRFLSGAIEGSLGFLDMIAEGGAKFSNYIEDTDEYHGSDLSGMFRDWVTGKNSEIIPEFDPSTNIPEHLKNSPMVGGVSGVTLNPDGTINRGESVVQQWKTTEQATTTQGTGGLMTPEADVKDPYELFAQAHHDIMAPVFRELHADTMKNLFIKNTDVIDNIFTKSLDKFLYTKSSIEGIITASSSEQGLSPAQIKQLEVMGMGSMNSGGFIPMETSIGGTRGMPSGGYGGGGGYSKKGSEGRKHLENNPAWMEQLTHMKNKYPGLSDDDLYRMIMGESGFNPQATNKSGASGLFQFMPATMEEIGTSRNEILGMDEVEQLKMYEKYLDRWQYSGGPLGIMQAAPAHANKSQNFEVYNRGTKAYSQNPGWVGPDGRITVASINAYYNKQKVPSGNSTNNGDGTTSATTVGNTRSLANGQLPTEENGHFPTELLRSSDRMTADTMSGLLRVASPDLGGLLKVKSSEPPASTKLLRSQHRSQADTISSVLETANNVTRPVARPNREMTQEEADRIMADYTEQLGVLKQQFENPDLTTVDKIPIADEITEMMKSMPEIPEHLASEQWLSNSGKITAFLENGGQPVQTGQVRPDASPSEEMTQEEAYRLMDAYIVRSDDSVQAINKANQQGNEEETKAAGVAYLDVLKSRPDIPEHLRTDGYQRAISQQDNLASKVRKKFSIPTDQVRPVARPNRDGTSAEASMSEVDKLRQAKLQAATMDPDRNEPIQMKYTTSEEEAKEKDRMKAMGASNKEVYDDHILRELRQITNETKRARRATEKNGSGLAPGSPAC